jgi:trehalose 6-phosphate synthase
LRYDHQVLRAFRFLLVLIAGLACLTWLAWFAVHRITAEWFERDLLLRSRLVVLGAKQTLATHWATDPARLDTLLEDITRDERIFAAAACDRSRGLLAATREFPSTISCEAMTRELDDRGGDPTSEWVARRPADWLAGGEMHVSANPVVDDGEALGFVVLVQDLSFLGRRQDKALQFLLIAFLALAFLITGATAFGLRFYWQSWTRGLRRMIRGEGPAPEFRPLVQDVRDLVERIATEREADGVGGHWTPQRLKLTLTRHLHGERVVILANREPYIHQRGADGKVSVLHPASGLVTALEPVMRACSGTWVAHGSGNADRETADAHARVKVPPGEESYQVRRVWLSPEEEQGYYYGFSNEGLWPLCHLAHNRPLFRGEDFKQYQRVNQRFADAVCDEVEGDDPIVLVQDYHFALAPQMIRARLPRATVITFWHIPWPNAERFGICPWRNQLLEGLLGSSILGFHTQEHCNNFFDSVDRYMEARLDRGQQAVFHHQRATLVRPYPISVDWPNRWAASAPPVAECRAQVRAELGLGPEVKLGVGVDRLDYTKGIEERLLAVERALEKDPQLRGRYTFVQLAAPSRTAIERYQQLNDAVEKLAERINARFATASWRPVVLHRSHHEPPTVFRYYRAADLCYVSSLHDGMNLVAKEFIAARDDEQGVLILSSFTGAARELTEALIVNPYDLDEAALAMAAALNMPADQQRERMRALRGFVAEFNVYRWAGRMLVDAARLRRREQVSGRLSTDHFPVAEGA